MKILSRMLSRKIDPEQHGAADIDDGEVEREPVADDTGRANPSRRPNSQAVLADPSQPITAKAEEPEVAGSGWESASWDDDDWDDDEDWGEEDMDIELRRRTADKKQLVSEIRDAMTSVNQERARSVAPSRPVSGAAHGAEDEGRQEKARHELSRPENEDRILEKTETAMTDKATSRRRSAMAHLKAAAAATKADRVLSHVVSRDPTTDPEEQSPYRDDLAKVVRPHSTSRPISRVVETPNSRSPIWDQGEGDEDAALFAAAEDGLTHDPAGAVEDEMAAAEAKRLAHAPVEMSAEDFASDEGAPTARTASAFPSSRFSRQPSEPAPDGMNAFDDIDEDDFDDDSYDDEDDMAPRPSSVVSEAVAFANAPDEVEDTSPPETEVRKKIWEMADEVAADLGQPQQEEPQSIVEVSTAVSGRAGRSAGRVKTRLLGFQVEDDGPKDVFQGGDASAQAKENGPTKYPAGWIIVVEGPGRGSCFTLQVGVSQIGRGEDQAVRLDFGDTSISRNNHAAVAYDDEQGKFFLGHGGKSNLVRLNGMPVLSTEELTSGDEIRIGETTLKFVALCGEGFTWASGETAAE